MAYSQIRTSEIVSLVGNMTVEFFLKRMHKLVPLSSLEARFLESLVDEVSEIAPNEDIVRKGERTSRLYIFLDGWACRYVIMPDGARQILACLLPGDVSNRYVGPAGRFNYSVAAMSRCTVASIAADRLENVERDHPNIARAFWLFSLMDEATTREWLISLGRRSAIARLAHLLCELQLRLCAIDLIVDQRFEFPVTQAQLADMIGISVVHVNRTLARLRRLGLIDFGHGWISVVDFEGLARLCAFDAAYLGDDISEGTDARAS